MEEIVGENLTFRQPVFLEDLRMEISFLILEGTPCKEELKGPHRLEA